jgi:filamentous hemagglutinin
VPSPGDASGKVENVLDLDKINSEFAIGKTLSQEAGAFLNYRAQEADAAQAAYDAEWNKGDQADPVKLKQLGDAADAAKPWGAGGTYRLVFTAVTSALSGNMSGSAAQAMQSAVVTTIQGLGAQQVKKILSDLPQGDPTTETLRTGLQAIVGCAGAAASGGSCGAGALGASASVVLNNLVDLATDTTASKLTAQEKEARMNLLDSLLGGATAALGGDAAATVLAARVEQENNALLPPGAGLLYAVYLGKGDIFEGARLLGRGEDPISRAQAAVLRELGLGGMVEQALSGFVTAGEGSVVLCKYLYNLAVGNSSEESWQNALNAPGAVAGWWYSNTTQDTRDQLAGIAGIALFEVGNKLGTGASSSEAGAAGEGANSVGAAGTTVVDQAATGMKWGKGISGQGIPFEDYVASTLPSETRLPANFKTFDFFDAETGAATSVKTLDTSTAAKVASPSQLYLSLKSNIDAVAGFASPIH